MVSVRVKIIDVLLNVSSVADAGAKIRFRRLHVRSELQFSCKVDLTVTIFHLPHGPQQIHSLFFTPMSTSNRYR